MNSPFWLMDALVARPMGARDGWIAVARPTKRL